MTGMRVGILGGTFDPPHRGHLQVLRHVRDQVQLDDVLVIPAGQPWQKSDVVASAAHRLAMTRAAFADIPGVIVSAVEVDRPGPAYTVDTLRALHEQRPDAQFFLILGADAAAGLSTWHEPEQVRALATLVVVTRTGAADGAVPADALIVPMDPIDISSTEIRQRCARSERIDDLVPPAVASYIHEHQLYLGADSADA